MTNESPAEQSGDDPNRPKRPFRSDETIVDHPVSSAQSSRSDENRQNEVAAISAEQSTENFIETYHAISEWIRFADAKSAVILTVGGAVAGFLIPTIRHVISDGNPDNHFLPFWQEVCVGLFAVYVIFFLLSGIYAFLCINPITRKGKHPCLDYCNHFHPAAIAAAYENDEVQKFISDCNNMGAAAMKREVQAAVLIDSHVSNRKYGRVKASLFHFAISVFFGFAYFLTSQF